ncbi:MAG: LysM peptidoglycan-binding domain-containing protein [Planctomycetes bacterium]|nr:LysM peptidoglycan-binding domain-containing protein [Planctomycetota bacterium]
MLSGKHLSMVVAAGALMLVAVLAATLFTPDDDKTSKNKGKKEQSISKVKLDTPPIPTPPLGYKTKKVEIEEAPDTPVDPIAVQPEPPKVTAKKGGVIDYKIKNGDAIIRIAKKYGCTPEDIYALNDGLDKSNAHKIRVGKTIKVPVGVEGMKAVKNSGAVKPERVSTEQTIVAEARDNMYSLSLDHYGVMRHFRKIMDANPHIDWDKPLQGGEQVTLPAIGGSGKTVSNNVPEKAKVERKSIIPSRN